MQFIGQIEGDFNGFYGVTYEQAACIRSTRQEAQADADALLAASLERGDTEPGQCVAVVEEV